MTSIGHIWCDIQKKQTKSAIFTHFVLILGAQNVQKMPFFWTFTTTRSILTRFLRTFFETFPPINPYRDFQRFFVNFFKNFQKKNLHAARLAFCEKTRFLDLFAANIVKKGVQKLRIPVLRPIDFDDFHVFGPFFVSYSS